MQPEAPRENELEDGAPARRLLLLLLCGLSAFTVGYLLVRELRSDAPYRQHQQRYFARAARASGKAWSADVRIRQLPGGPDADRCPTCHLAMAGAGLPLLEGGRNPDRPHPGRLLADHPPSRFACTACHGAGGLYVDRCLPAQGDADGRALDQRRAQAACPLCHRNSEAEHLPGAERLTLGLQAYRRLGCSGCHRAAPLDAGTRIGPPLQRAGEKLVAGFVRAFLADPQRVRPGTAMPSFFSDEALRGAPPFRLQQLRSARALHLEQLAAFVLGPPAGASGAPPQLGDPARGRQRFSALGCVACHLAADSRRERTSQGLGGIGPDLEGIGRRLQLAWLERWLQAPTRYNAETRMPNPRLSDEERRDLVAYLSTLIGGPTLGGAERPALARRAEGQALAATLGCAGCHRLEGGQEHAPVGPELDGFGDKVVDLLDWGAYQAHPRERSVWTWIRLKLTQPLAFDRRPGLLLMPRQHLRPGELEGLELVLRSLSEQIPSAVAPQRESVPQQMRRGERVVQALGCRQCHSIRGRGGALSALLARPSDRPPALEQEGSKVQSSWLYGFLQRPYALRPWLALRMPTFALRVGEAEQLTAYFAALERVSYPFYVQQSQPLHGASRAVAWRLFQRMQCLRCHLLSNAPKLTPGELAPDLALSGVRLRREWIQLFLLEPQRLMPGSKMPTLFPLADEDQPSSRTTPEPGLLGGDVAQQVEALVELNLQWSSLAPQLGLELGPQLGPQQAPPQP